MDGYNSDIKSEQVQKLAELFPEAVREGKVDFDALKATLGEDVEYGEKYGLGWKGKSGVFAKIQQKSVSTLHPQLDESVDWDTTQNMFIEGDNLEALKVLHKAYYGKIKMIYIDPPYNTGNDFVYNDDFAKTRRQNAMDEGAIDDEGNATRDDGLRANTGGHKHSNWLDMMYPRLFLARNLLRQDGVIFVSIDDNEVHNLRLMMNEIFGEENFVGQIVWNHSKQTKNDEPYLASNHNYIVAFRRSDKLGAFGIPREERHNTNYSNPDDDPSGAWRAGDVRSPSYRQTLRFAITTPSGNKIEPPENGWRWNEDQIKEKVSSGEIIFNDNESKIIRKIYLKDQFARTPESIWDGAYYGTTRSSNNTIKTLFDGKAVFDTPKPTELIKGLIGTLSLEEDYKNMIVLDFFSGSGTTAHAVDELNAEDDGDRKWVMVQLPELTDEKSEAHKAGYKTISSISRERIRRAGAKISKDLADKIAERETPLDLGFRSYVLGDSNFKKWNEQMRDADEIRQATLDQLDPIEDGASDDGLLTEVLLKRGISPLVEMEMHKDFIFIPSETLAISPSRHMTQELFGKILAQNPSQIILLDQAFKDDVNLKTNLVLQAEKQNIAVEVL